VCERHRIGLMGTCEVESIYGELRLFDLDNPAGAGFAAMPTASAEDPVPPMRPAISEDADAAVFGDAEDALSSVAIPRKGPGSTRH
jgi:hypothetical protein